MLSQKIWSLLTHLLIRIVFIFAFGISTSNESIAQEKFKVGAVLPLTGAAADYGIAIKNCIDLAKKENPDLFTNIDFLYEDAAYDPKTAVSAYRSLTDGKQVKLTVTWGVSFCKALAPIAETKRTPLVGICLDPTVARDRQYVLRFKNTTDEMMRVQAQYLFEHNVKRIGLLLAEHPYLEELKEALQRNLVPGQTMVVIDQIPNNEMDLRTNILKLRKKKDEFDSIGVFLFAGQIASFYKQAREVGFNIPTFGTDFFESISEIKSSNGTMNGVIFSSIAIKGVFLRRYQGIFHNESQLAFGAAAYEFAMTVGKLFNDSHRGLSEDEIVRKFASVPEQDGVASGPYRYVNDPKAGQYFQFPVVVKKIVGEGFEEVR
jgi:ABC-type branched-subunit amino acid transport system substrate-binding protein